MPFSPKVIKCQETLLKVNESRYIVVYLASGSIKTRFPIDCVNIYLLSIFFFGTFLKQVCQCLSFLNMFSIDLAQCKSVAIPLAYVHWNS